MSALHRSHSLMRGCLVLGCGVDGDASSSSMALPSKNILRFCYVEEAGWKGGGAGGWGEWGGGGDFGKKKVFCYVSRKKLSGRGGGAGGGAGAG